MTILLVRLKLNPEQDASLCETHNFSVNSAITCKDVQNDLDTPNFIPTRMATTRV
ncbi:MAG: hypothetical protein ACI831_000278, partial [Candidatus Azotimanducaceae bacterium]